MPESCTHRSPLWCSSCRQQVGAETGARDRVEGARGPPGRVHRRRGDGRRGHLLAAGSRRGGRRRGGVDLVPDRRCRRRTPGVFLRQVRRSLPLGGRDARVRVERLRRWPRHRCDRLVAAGRQRHHHGNGRGVVRQLRERGGRQRKSSLAQGLRRAGRGRDDAPQRGGFAARLRECRRSSSSSSSASCRCSR